MTTIYMKSSDERNVISLRAGGGAAPRIPQYLKKNGWIVVEPKEFRRIKARIYRRTHTHPQYIDK